DGGDGLFGGYNRHVWAARMARRGAAGAMAARAIRAFTPERSARVLAALAPFASVARQRLAREKLDKLARVLATSRPEEFYLGLLSQWPYPELLVLGATEPPLPAADAREWPQLGGLTEQIMFLDALGYLPD